MKVREVMESARLKVKRANRHIDEIIADQATLPKYLYDLEVSHRSLAPLNNPDGDFLKYTPKQPISKHFGAIVGDIVNNLRESLDIWINTAAQCVGHQRSLHFPFSKERTQLETSKSFCSLKKAFPEAASFIADKIEPCKDSNLYLWAATSLCNNNKHNDFVPVVVLNEIKAKRIMMGTSEYHDLTMGGDASRPQNLILTPYKSLIIKGRLKVSVETNFPTGAVFENQAVIPTLTHMSKAVSQTLDSLEVFIGPYCK